jgi:ATP-dependent Lhr-like helicase
VSDAFGLLSGTLQQAIVNGLGFRDLRPVQLLTIEAVLAGKNCIVLAPTAGGKTEAAFFPVLSRMDTESWSPVGAIYLSPIRALLNNQEERISRYAMLVGRTAFKWHGDTTDSLRRRFLAHPADILLTTPESLEAMLMSPRVDAARIFGGLQSIVIDEIHSFAAGDRGAHLVSVLERLGRYARRDVQRIGLSATVGNPETILSWLQGSSRREGTIIQPGGSGGPPRIDIDFVGSLPNAAVVIDALYRGRKRLCFVDSRAKAEQLAEMLHKKGCPTFVTHGSLSVDERQLAERAFHENTNCVIVATSALELGIDVGDLDHVLQIDASSSVASFLQRMGRTGRRQGTTANCTFLATSPEALLRATALIRLYDKGFVEPVNPPHEAAHILAHQLMALSLQEHGVAEADWFSWISGATCFSGLEATDRESLISHMITEGILHRDGGRLSLGPEGERRYGRRNFEELYAVFSTPRLLSVHRGGSDIGSIDANFLQALRDDDEPLCFLLAGKAWRVVHLDWSKASCEVVESDTAKAPRWQGSPAFLGPDLCRAMRDVLSSTAVDPRWSRRAVTAIEKVRTEHPFVMTGRESLVSLGSEIVWWTFAGGRANLLLGRLLERALGGRCIAQNEKISLRDEAGQSLAAVRSCLLALRQEDRPSAEDARVQALLSAGKTRLSKFEPCLPPALLARFLAHQLTDHDSAREAVRETTL